jgi:hypothetical protein
MIFWPIIRQVKPAVRFGVWCGHCPIVKDVWRGRRGDEMNVFINVILESFPDIGFINDRRTRASNDPATDALH